MTVFVERCHLRYKRFVPELKMIWVAGIVIALASAAFTKGSELGGQVAGSTQSVECTPGGIEHSLAPSEVKELLKSASTPNDHLKLAAHFREEATQEESAAKWNERMAACTESGAARRHCERLVIGARRAAAHALKSAEEQTRIAEAMQNGSFSGIRHSR